jgi:hypothetical protein
MQFQVPQFIEIEDKIFGPLTIKQFIYITGGAGLAFIVYRLLSFVPIIIMIPIAIVIVSFSLAMAFYPVNGKPLINILQSAFGYYLSSKLYLWKKKDKTPERKESGVSSDTNLPPVYVPKLSQSKLHDLSWSLDIKESLNPVTQEQK